MELDKKVCALKLKAAALPLAALAAAQSAADVKAAALLAARDTGRTWLLADMDQFFLACHALTDPSLAERCVAVGSPGMISTASYKARAFGVRSAMPGFIALKLCPHLEFIRPCFELYIEKAREVRRVLASFDPDFQPLGLDEAALDVTDWCAARACDGLAAAAALRAAVRTETGLAVSVGIAPNKMLAKVVCDLGAKPDGAATVPRDPAALAAYVAALPTRAVGGIGRVSEAVLAALGVHTLGQLHAARGLCACLFSASTADFFLEVSLGVGSDRHPTDRDRGRRGLSAERTFAATADGEVLAARVTGLAHHIADRATEEGLKPRTITLKLKYASFEVKTRAGPLVAGGGRAVPTRDTVAAAALRLLQGEPLAGPVRLVGVRLSGFEGGERAADQPSVADLFGAVGGGSAPASPCGGSAPASPRSRSRSRSPPPPPPPRAPADPTALPKTWTCLACTYAGTPRHALRCAVCDTLRGSRAPTPPPAAPAAPTAARKPPPRSPRRAAAAGVPPLTRFFASKK